MADFFPLTNFLFPTMMPLSRLTSALLISLSLSQLTSAAAFQNKEQDIVLTQAATQKTVPTHVYLPQQMHKSKKTPVILLSGGYKASAQDSYLSYRFLAEALSAQGFAVISVQHESKDDAPLAFEGNIVEQRLPTWTRGVDNLQAVRKELAKKFPTFQWKKIFLIGHSHGGDISTLYAEKNSAQLAGLITLDHRRMPLPRNHQLPVLSLRSSDQTADAGVLIADDDVSFPNIQIVPLDGVLHNAMDDSGDEETKAKILMEVRLFFRNLKL